METHEIALKTFGRKPKYFYNAGVGRGYSNKEVVEMVKEVTGLTFNVECGPRREGDADSLYASIDKIKKDFSWYPKHSLEDIIKTAFEWHKNTLRDIIKEMRFIYRIAHLIIPRESNNQKAKLLHNSSLTLITFAFILYQLIISFVPKFGSKY